MELSYQKSMKTMKDGIAQKTLQEESVKLPWWMEIELCLLIPNIWSFTILACHLKVKSLC